MGRMMICFGEHLTGRALAQIHRLLGRDYWQWCDWLGWRGTSQWDAGFCGWPDESRGKQDVREFCGTQRLPDIGEHSPDSRVILITTDPSKVEPELAQCVRTVIAEGDLAGLRVEFDKLVADWLARIPSSFDRDYFKSRYDLSKWGSRYLLTSGSPPTAG